jgi:8-oxo-dGTP diphosphatase
MSKKDRPIIVGLQCFVRKNGKYLMLKRHDSKQIMPGVWMAPGGTREFAEGLFNCARREILEETGLKINNLSVRAVGTAFLKDINQEIHFHFLTADFASGKLKPETGVGKLKWLKTTEILRLDNLLSEHKHILPHVFSSDPRVVSFRCVYSKGNDLEEIIIEKP